MIYDFTFYNPTRVHFGKNAMEHLSEELNNFGENILFLLFETTTAGLPEFNTELSVTPCLRT